MMQIPFFLPLLAGGLIGAIWREYRQVTPLYQLLALPDPAIINSEYQLAEVQHNKVFDDVGEIYHYQRISWYSLAFAASGSWFYPPAILVSIPLLSYNSYYFAKTLRQSDRASRKSAITVFEVIGVAGSIITAQPVMTSILFLLVFGSRKMLLQAGNIANIGFSNAISPRFASVWVLRDGSEIETSIHNLQNEDIVVVHNGDMIPIEGAVINGEGIICQFSLQKKLKFIPKQAGDKVFPYTQLQSGCLYIRQN